jgi:hypothetical protein
MPVEKIEFSEVYDIITDKMILLDFFHFGYYSWLDLHKSWIDTKSYTSTEAQ